MSEYIAVTGKLGSGKGLCSVGRMCDYLRNGKPVITNMDIFPENFKDKKNKTMRIYRIPDQPKPSDIVMCGRGNDIKDPEENGVAVLDELATWFNSHNWNSKEAKQLNDLLVHLRKLGWDGIFQVQSLESMNSQARRNIITSEAKCAHVRKIYVPYLSPLLRALTGKAPKLPRSLMFHRMEMINLETNITEEKLRYTGKQYHNLYDTSQMFSSEYPHGTFCYLTPWHLVGRYQEKKRFDMKKIINFCLVPFVYIFTLIDTEDNLIRMGVLKKRNQSIVLDKQ
ncbi:MAG TPA: zonular occludens toxin domain-containing protein [Psychromonas sp.]